MRSTLAVAVVALFALAGASPVVSRPKVAVIPLSKRPSSVDERRAGPVHLEGKYNRAPNKDEPNTEKRDPNAASRHISRPGVKRNSGTLPLTGNNNRAWYGVVSIGTPPVNFVVDFDTGSSDFFVPDASCTTCGAGRSTYDAQHSSTGQEDEEFYIQFADGSSASGVLFTEVVTVAGLTIPSLTFGSATEYTGILVTEPADGLLGLGFTEASDFGVESFFSSLIGTGTLDEEVFSIYLNGDSGELVLGGTNPARYIPNSIIWFNVIANNYWEIGLYFLMLNRNPIPGVQDGINALVDSGTTYIYGPSDAVTQFYTNLGGQDASATLGPGFYTYPCNANPTVTIQLANNVIMDVSGTFNDGMVAGSTTDCVGSLVAQNSNSWILGAKFMTTVYSVFDVGNARIGFGVLA